MSDDREPGLADEARLLQQLHASQDEAAHEPSRAHDTAVLQAARAAGQSIRRRNAPPGRAAWLPASLAAAVLLGIAIGRGSWLLQAGHPLPAAHLSIPAAMTVRGTLGTAGTVPVPVEQADPAAWYRYIQELVFSGQVELAEQHLRRFHELHPDFVYQP
jgi:hypothetical protein